MFVFFSILVLASPIAVVVSAILWAISAVRKKPSKAKRVLAVSAAIFAIGFIGCVLTAPPVEKQPEGTQPSEAQNVAAAPIQEPVSGPEGNATEDASARPQEPIDAPEEPTQEGVVEMENLMDSLSIQEHPVMNGFKTERIGTWASISTTKDILASATDEQLFEFLNEAAENNYNWINIFFGDGTGLYCMSSMGGYYIEYGAVDEDEGGATMFESDVTTRYFHYADGSYVEDIE